MMKKKKFEEFDINCKTNTYNARYKYYNEIGCSEYSEDKKYKTTPIHDFTEEEIKENYENMMDKTKTAIDRWLFAGKYKNLKHLVHFLRLIEYIDLKLCRINRGYTRLKGEVTRTHFDNQNTLFMRGFEEEGEHEVSREYGERDLWTMEEGPGKQIHELLTNPQYILIMPLLDVLFEVWRENGYWKGDGTLMGVDISKTVFTMQDDRIGRSFSLYERTLEYQHYQLVNDCWGITDYMDEIDEDLDEDLDNIVMRYPMIPSIIFYFFFLPFIMIYGLYYGPGLDVPLQSLVVNGQYHLAWYDYLNIRRPSIYFELELKAPRNFLPYGTRIRRLRVRERIPHYKYRPFRPKHWLSKETNILGYSFLEQSKINYYSVFTENRRVFKPFNLGWRLWYFLDSRNDDLFLPIHDYIVWFGRKTAISIYHVDGTLRVRWWTKLAAWIQDYLERQVNRFLNWIAPLQETTNLSDFDEVKAGKNIVEFIEEQDVIFVEERKKYKESAFYLFLTIFFIWFIIMFLLWWFV